MIFAPLSWNTITSVERSAGSRRGGYHRRGQPEENLADTVLDLRWGGRGKVPLHANNRMFQYNLGAGNVSLQIGVNWVTDGAWRSIDEVCAKIMAGLVASGVTNLRIYQLSTSADYGKVKVEATSGTVALPIATGTNTTKDVLRKVLGYRNADRSAAASHIGDFPVRGGIDFVEFNCPGWGSATRQRRGYFLVGADVSPGAAIGAASAATWQTLGAYGVSQGDYYVGDVCEVMFWRHDEVLEKGGADVFMMYDAHRADIRQPAAAYWYAGPIFDTDDADTSARGARNFDLKSLSFALEPRSDMRDTLAGHPSINARRSSEVINLAFSAPAGMSAAGGITLTALLDALGNEQKLLLCLDENEPGRMSRMCIVEDRKVRTLATHSPHGRVEVQLKLRCLDVRGRVPR